MASIKIEFPADDKKAAAIFSEALAKLAGIGSKLQEYEYDGHAYAPAKKEEEEVTHIIETDTISGETLPHEIVRENGGREYIDAPNPSLFDGGKSADTAVTETAPSSDIAGGAASLKVDAAGVPFNSDFCAEAKDPFYGSGKRLGFWKKRRGVSDEAYDSWHAQEMAKSAAVSSGIPVNPATAFAAQGVQPAAPAPQNIPQDAGQFMGWVSEQQARGALTQDMINAAWQEAGIGMQDIFNADPAIVARNIAAVYNVLVGKL